MILTGEDLENLSDEQLDKKILSATIFARVTPQHKLKIVQSYKRCGKIIAMTGVVITLQLAAIYLPFMQKILHTVPLNPSDWLLIVATASSILIVEEIRKFIVNRYAVNN